MNSKTLSGVAVLMALLALGACENRFRELPLPEDAARADTEDRSPFAETDMKLMVYGFEARSVASSPERIDALLLALDAPAAPGNSVDKLNALLQNPSKKLDGLGGVQSRAMLHVAETAFDNGKAFAGPVETVTVKGQIQQSVVHNGVTEPGFQYMAGRPLHIWVQMITTATRTAGPNPKSKSSAEMFRVEIPFNAVSVEPKNLQELGNVFPGFGASAFPINVVAAAGFEYKLWAVGRDVSVTDYWVGEVRPDGTVNYPPGQKYTASNHIPKYASIFERDDKACFDMMFAEDPAPGGSGLNPDGTLPNGSKPPYYCLGRCANPPIVNTR